MSRFDGVSGPYMYMFLCYGYGLWAVKYRFPNQGKRGNQICEVNMQTADVRMA